MPYINTHITTYLDKQNALKDDLLLEIMRQGIIDHVPIIGNDVASFLQVQLMIAKPSKILELGTAIGYSGSLMLRASKADLTTVELEESTYDIASETFERLNLSNRVTQHLGDASVILGELIDRQLSYDFIFIDAAKGHYLDYFKKCEKLVSYGGIIIADNVLFNGYVAGLPHIRRQKTIVSRMQAFVDYVMQHENYQTSLLSIGDGVLMCVKNSERIVWKKLNS